MPLYDYSCDACGRTFEVNQRMSDPPLTACECGQDGTVRRLMATGAGVVFKGSGFYQTDYKPRPTGGGDSAKSDTKATESKPATTESSTTATGCGASNCCMTQNGGK